MSQFWLSDHFVKLTNTIPYKKTNAGDHDLIANDVLQLPQGKDYFHTCTISNTVTFDST